ncbi:hypothetical protein ACIQAC_30065 [Streptomyces sp. NPDC088387]
MLLTPVLSLRNVNGGRIADDPKDTAAVADALAALRANVAVPSACA